MRVCDSVRQHQQRWWEDNELGGDALRCTDAKWDITSNVEKNNLILTITDVTETVHNVIEVDDFKEKKCSERGGCQSDVLFYCGMNRIKWQLL